MLLGNVNNKIESILDKLKPSKLVVFPTTCCGMNGYEKQLTGDKQ